MASLPQESMQNADLPPLSERVVISGISGLFPQADSVKEFSDMLYNKVNPITKEEDWTFQHPESSKYYGKNKNLNYFDAQFFKVHYRLCQSMDPMSRKFLEQTYQAIYDAGLSPDHLNGKKVSVYIGSDFSEKESSGFYKKILKSTYEVLGCSKTMFANRISYWLNTKGASAAINSSGSSGLLGLELAYMDLMSGRCDAAIVGASHMAFYAHYTIHYGRVVPLSPDGKTRAFDQNANGLAMSDATVVLFLQKAKDALRVYGELVNVSSRFIQTERVGDTDFSFYRSPSIAVKFLKEFYENTKVSPDEVQYVEAFGTGIPELDKTELESIDQVFCQKRTSPLLVGSVISNVGYTEASAGLTAITKVLLGFDNGILAGNLHCTNPRQDVSAIRDGRISIVTDHTDFNCSYAAVNEHCYTGISSHVLLRGHLKPKNTVEYHCSIPYLITISNRTEEGVQNIFNDLKSRPINHEELALLRNIHSRNISGHLGRGYAILDTKENKTVSLCEKAERVDTAKSPLWFVYSGMGSQWVGMGAQLMRIPIFAAAIERCHQVLAPRGIDIVHIITTPDKTIFDNIQNSFVGIAAIQIGLTDILRHLGVVPDNIIGHSVGELGCAYADGCMTAEEMILAAYSRGKVSLDTPFIKGSMAAVGLGYEQIRDLCPPEIEVACHNGPESCTISGPADAMKKFVSSLTEKGVFAKEVPCSQIAYHSRYIADAGPGLKKYLSEFIKNLKLRSKKWLSTSVPQSKWDEPEAKYCSAEYHTNNLLRPVLFEETSRLIPANAVLVEVAPHGLLQPILKRSLPQTCRNVALTKRGHKDNVLFLLDAVGQLYMEGFSLNVQALYPKVEFPVSSGTPMLSHLVEWSHTEEWELPSFLTLDRKQAAACEFMISMHNDEHMYTQGNVVRGKVLYPFAASLVAAWDTLAMSLSVGKKSQSVEFSDVHLYAEPMLHDQQLLELRVALNRGNGWFEITNKISKVATGYINVYTEEKTTVSDNKTYDEYEHKSEEIYEVLKARDYSYSNELRSIHSVESSLTKAIVKWNDNWVTHIDGLLQLNALRRAHDGISQPAFIKKLLIDVKKHGNEAVNIDQTTVFNAEISDIHEYTRCGGIIINNLRFRDLPRHNEYKFKLLAPTPDGNMKEIEDFSMDKNNARTPYMTLQSEIRGDLNSLQWVETSEPSGTGIKVLVHYAGLNNRDVKEATGTLAQQFSNNSYGMDFSGVTESGSRVMGLIPHGACSSEVRASSELLWPVPEHWTLEDAATVPLAYAYAFYCLCIKTESLLNKTVLVHGGTGALGQAAIAIALAHRCEVFATVGDLRKVHFLRKLYPALKEDHIGNSRDSSFGDMVLTLTKGRGCDIIISSVNGDLKDISLKCAGLNGVTFDSVQVLNQETYQYGMFHMTKQRSYIALDFSSIFDTQKCAERKDLQLLISEGIALGYVRPLTRVTYAPQAAPRALRLLAASAHRGRVLLHLRDTHLHVLPRITCSSHRCNVIICDGSALCIHLANRLIQRGAKKLYIHLLNETTISKIILRFWQILGAHVEVSSEILSDKSAAVKLLTRANSLGYIEGIFVVATDRVENITNQELTSLAINIDVASKSICPQAKHFALLTAGREEPMISLSGSKDHLPKTFLSLSVSITGAPVTQLGSWCQSVLDALEDATHTKHNVLIAQRVQQQQTTVQEELASISGIDIFERIADDMSLTDMRLHEAEVKTLSTYLLHKYNVAISEKELLRLNKQSINGLVNSLEEHYYNEVEGIAKFFPRVEPDELTASAETIFLPTRARPIVANSDDFEGFNSCVCIIPGMEGLSSKFKGMCERLKIPALVLQPGLDRPYESISDTAERFAKTLLAKIGVKNNFYLIGYETGTLIALEVAAILETCGFEGTIFCVGCAPHHVKSIVEKELSNYETEIELQDAIIRHMFTLMTNGDIAILDEAIRYKSSWGEKLEACVRLLKGHVKYSTQYAKAVIESAYGRLIEACCYNFTAEPLKSRVILMQSPNVPSSFDNELCQPAAIHELVAPLSSAPNDMRCSSIINKYLSSDNLEEFENKNWCEIYLDDYRSRFADC